MALPRLVTFSAALIAVCAAAVSAPPPDPAAGSWRLNADRSQLADPAPRSEIRTYEPVSGGMKISVTTVELDGSSKIEHFDYIYDGKDHPVTGSPNYDSVAVTAVDARTTHTVMKRGGKAVGSFHRVVSPDGKTLTLTITLTAVSGQTTIEKMVYDKEG